MQVIDGAKLGTKSRQKVSSGIKPLVQILQPILDDRFVLVHTLAVSGRHEKVDALLVGPHGALVLKVENDEGRYRCLGDNWYIWDKKINNFIKAEDNPLRDLKQGQNLVEAILASQGLGSAVPVSNAVLFVNSKLQLEHMEPAVTLIEHGAIKKWAAQLPSTVYVEKREIEKTLAAFGVQVSVAHSPRVTVEEDGVSAVGGARPAAADWLKGRGQFGLRRWQLVAMGVTVGLYVLVLAVGIYVVLTF